MGLQCYDLLASLMCVVLGCITPSGVVGGGTPTPTSAGTQPATVKQSVIFTNLDVSTYTGVVKAAYEFGFAQVSVGTPSHRSM